MKRHIATILIALYLFGAAFSWGVWSAQSWPHCHVRPMHGDCAFIVTGQMVGSIIWPFVWVIRLGTVVGK